MYKPSLFARLFYSVETLKLLELLYRDSTEIREWTGVHSATYNVSVYCDDGSTKAIEFTVNTDKSLMHVEYFNSDGTIRTDHVNCNSVFYDHVKALRGKWNREWDIKMDKERRAKLVDGLSKVDLSCKRLTVDKT
jgi:hypothetical protein